MNRLREIAHLSSYNDEAEEWFIKYMKYKEHQERRITALLQSHFPPSNIAGYNLAHRAEVRRSFITTTVRDESQVTPQGRHR